MATGTKRDRIVANVVAALKAIDGSAGASTTVNAESTAGGYALYVASAIGFTAGEPIMVNAGGAREEVVIVATTGSGVLNLASTTSLAYTHTLAQADGVKERWYNHNLGSRVKSWKGLRIGADGPFPCGGVLALGEKVYADVELFGGAQVWTMSLEAVLFDHVPLTEPTDQDNDEEFTALLHDIFRALMADRSRGGLALDTRITGSLPVTEETLDDRTSEMPLVGASVTFEVDYQHKTGNLYA